MSAIRRRSPRSLARDVLPVPERARKHLRTTNVVESPFAAVRLRTAAAKRFKKVEHATAIIWKTLLVARGRAELPAPQCA